MPAEDQHDIVRLASAANPFQAHIWQQALEQEGIRCQVLGDYLDSAFGDIPGVRAEVWVESADLARAEAILREHQSGSEEGTMKTHNTSTYHCITCGRVVHATCEVEPPYCCGHSMAEAFSETFGEGNSAGKQAGGPTETLPPENQDPQKPR